jgi:MscS family membrane protein
MQPIIFNFFGQQPWQLFLASLLAWAGIVLVVYLAFTLLVGRFVARLVRTLDDALFGSLSRPLAVLLSIYGIHQSVLVFGTPFVWLQWLDRAFSIAFVLALTYTVAHVFLDVFLYNARRRAAASDSAALQLLLPVLGRIGTPLIYILGLVAALGNLGIDLSGVWVALGGGAFVLAFALQNILGDFFSGMVLLVDTPFRPGDVIYLQDMQLTAVINNIGVRVTQLYNIHNHNDIYIPNSAMAKAVLHNLNRPSALHAIELAFATERTEDPKKITEILHDVANGHPDVIGKVEEKIAALDRFEGLRPAGEQAGSYSKRVVARVRLKAEYQLNMELNAMHNQLRGLSTTVHRVMAAGHLTAGGRAELRAECEKIMREIGFLATGERRIVTSPEAMQQGLLQPVLRQITKQEDPRTLITRTRAWVEVLQADPDLFPEDLASVAAPWGFKYAWLEAHMGKMFALIQKSSGMEKRLADLADELRTYLATKFKSTEPGWIAPQVRVTMFNDTFVAYRLRYYVDNLRLEHWRRTQRIEGEITKEVFRRFNASGVTLPKAMFMVGSQRGDSLGEVSKLVQPG